MRHGASYGVSASSVEVDFGRVMQRMRQLRAEISHVDSASRFRDLGIDVYQVSATSAGFGAMCVTYVSASGGCSCHGSKCMLLQHTRAPHKHALHSAVHRQGRLPAVALSRSM